jgi:hypothetical protein
MEMAASNWCVAGIAMTACLIVVTTFLVYPGRSSVEMPACTSIWDVADNYSSADVKKVLLSVRLS